MNLRYTDRFHHDYERLPKLIQDGVNRQLTQLLANPRHPSLRLKRMKGTKSYWEIRVTLSHRILLEIRDDAYLLFRVGPHDILRRP